MYNTASNRVYGIIGVAVYFLSYYKQYVTP